MANKLVIFGCGGHARSVADVYLQNNPNAEIIFIDKNARENEKILGFTVVKTYEITDEKVFVALGENQERADKIKQFKNIETIISKSAYIGKDVDIDKGVLVAHNTHIGIASKIGVGTIVNTSASIDHEVTIGQNCHIAPNATICGRTQIGDNVFVGAGATIIDKIKICSNVTIGAGSVVVSDISEDGTYVGAPARKIK